MKEQKQRQKEFEQVRNKQIVREKGERDDKIILGKREKKEKDRD